MSKKNKNQKNNNNNPNLDKTTKLDVKNISANSAESFNESAENQSKNRNDDIEPIEAIIPKSLLQDEKQLIKEPVEEQTIVFDPIVDEEPPAKVKKKKDKWYKPSNIFAAFLIIVIVASLAIGTIALSIGYNMIQNGPEVKIEDFIGAESSKVYAADGGVLTELGAYLRENVSYDEISESVVDAFISIEDSRFFEHNGFDIPRFTKAALENLKSGSFAQGGSTFTMQLVKNTYFSIDDINDSTVAEKKIDRKVQEIWISMDIEKKLSKQEIFELYLNKLNFGGNIRGIQKASYYYFGKTVSEINLSEAALLAGIVNLPNSYNPYDHLDWATTRRNEVLDLMVYHGYISQNECDLAKAIHIEDQLVGEHRTYTQEGSDYQSYIDAVIEEAQQLTGKDPNTTSMQIYTYMDRGQQELVDDLQDGTIDVGYVDDLQQVAMVCMDNTNGAIVAIGGGRYYDGARLLNRATSQYKQPGSSVKPFLSYALAFEHLYWSSSHVLCDKPITYIGQGRVIRNADREYLGDIFINQAVAQSRNIPAIEAIQQVIEVIGKKGVVEYLQEIGFSRVSLENFDESYAIGGTTFETTVVEMAGAHGMIINGGVYNEPHTIEKIVMSDGSVVYPQNQNIRVLSTGAAYLTSELMQYNVEGPYFNFMQILKRDYPVYAKTGTTDWGNSGISYGIPEGAGKDSWMIASTSHYTNAIWLGYDKAIAGKDTYMDTWKIYKNLTGQLQVYLLDGEEAISGIPQGVQKPDDIENITYVAGSWPYAYPEDWMYEGQVVTAEIRTGHPDLISIYDIPVLDNQDSATFGEIYVSKREDGAIIVKWSGGVSGVCSDGQKDISLHDQYGNNVDAWGACIFDMGWITGQSGAYYWGNVKQNGEYVMDISGPTAEVWLDPSWGGIEICGGMTVGDTTYGPSCKYVE